MSELVTQTRNLCFTFAQYVSFVDKTFDRNHHANKNNLAADGIKLGNEKSTIYYIQKRRE